jgi:hypothetical protein
MRTTLRFSSERFIPRNHHTYPELQARTPRVTRRIRLLPGRTPMAQQGGMMDRPGDHRR